MAEMASAFNLTVGSELTVTEFGDHTKQLVAQVAGVWQPKSASDPYWNGLDFNPDDTSPPVFPVLISTTDFFAQLPQFGGVGMHQTWVYYTQTQRINGANSATVANDVAEFRQQRILGASGPLASPPFRCRRSSTRRLGTCRMSSRCLPCRSNHRCAGRRPCSALRDHDVWASDRESEPGDCDVEEPGGQRDADADDLYYSGRDPLAVGDARRTLSRGGAQSGAGRVVYPGAVA